MIQQIQSMCSDCQGQGEKFSAKDRCKNCNGRKVERKKKILEVHIDKGVCAIDYKYAITYCNPLYNFTFCLDYFLCL